MVYTQNILEWIKAAGTVFAAISLYLAYRQLRANVRWNRINSTFTYLPEAFFLERERAAAAAIQMLHIDLYKQLAPLDASTVDAILANSDVFKELKDFLNMFENYSAAYKAGAIDPDHSYILNASQFIRYLDIFYPLITRVRKERDNRLFWIEFERLAEHWRKRQKEELKSLDEKRDDARRGDTYP